MHLIVHGAVDGQAAVIHDGLGVLLGVAVLVHQVALHLVEAVVDVPVPLAQVLLGVLVLAVDIRADKVHGGKLRLGLIVLGPGYRLQMLCVKLSGL